MTAKEENVASAVLDTAFSDGLIAFCRAFRAQALSAEARRRSTDAITDTLGCMALGTAQTLEPKLRRALFSASALKQMLAQFQPDVLRVSSTEAQGAAALYLGCLLYTSPSPRDGLLSRMPSSA